MFDTTEDLTHAFGRILLRAQAGDTDMIVVGLAYHVALYVNPTKDAGYDDRYCIHSVDVAARAIEHFKTSGEMCFWQKHHNKRLRSSGGFIYHDNDLCIPSNALRAVNWNTELIAKTNGARVV